MVAFLSELNGLDLWATDIGNAYLEAKTSELLFIVAGPEFGDLEGHMLVIYKVLYGLCSSGDKICMMMTRLTCNQAIESSYWRMDNNLDVGLLMGYVLYQLLIELEFMDLQ
jgi:hypothetical protein